MLAPNVCLSQTCGCIKDKAWAIVNDDKIYRITFSKSLAEYIAQKKGFKIERIKFYLGKQIDPG